MSKRFEIKESVMIVNIFLMSSAHFQTLQDYLKKNDHSVNKMVVSCIDTSKNNSL